MALDRRRVRQQFGARRRVRDRAAIEDDGAIGERQHLLRLLFDDDHREPAAKALIAPFRLPVFSRKGVIESLSIGQPVSPSCRARSEICPEIPTASPLANSRSIVINRIMVLDRGGFGMLVRDYFRGDQQAGVTAPDLTKECDFHDHIVHARGKKTNHTSVSLNRQAIARFGECDYLLLRDKLAVDNHKFTEHESLISRLTELAQSETKSERNKALQAIRYARRRKEGLVTWNFDFKAVERKDLVTWAFNKIQPYFRRI